MHETPIPHVNARVRGAAVAEHHQVAGAQLLRADRFAEAAQLGHGARRCHAGVTQIHVTDQSTAVKAACWRVATVAVRRTHQPQGVHRDVTCLFRRQAGMRGAL